VSGELLLAIDAGTGSCRAVLFDVDGSQVAIGPPLIAYPESEVRFYAEEHCLVDFPGPPPLGLGDTAEVMSGYGPTTVNLHDVFHVVGGGVVTDIWPVSPRGPGRP